ncbi:hypothetical protein GH714_005829 [Hevea brasiliensis]|uniref:Rhamnogalacturonase A/B/Epimerase-like pectate lyase domain-containing protein n=1 Tax=Hevea brasiliensis TaxID=3981 RepID=A0A6A6L930_HEVBR|nr:hypothetical protein GH714_005829 [Hevea brasiliensis]
MPREVRDNIQDNPPEADYAPTDDELDDKGVHIQPLAPAVSPVPLRRSDRARQHSNRYLTDYHFAVAGVVTCSGIVPMRYRNDKISITDFGGVGDGRTLNTKAFREAIYRIQHLRRRGGTLLYVPPGVYLTGSFNLTSRMTLYLARGAVIKATQFCNGVTVCKREPPTSSSISCKTFAVIISTQERDLLRPFPGFLGLALNCSLAILWKGRERPGGRYMSFIHGDGLHDVVITGENGTIDGQGDVWWNMWRQRTLQFTRPNLVEIINSRSIIISNVIFRNSPFWNIHPVYCSNVVIRFVTILAPHDSPNTDGIDPDSSSNVCIEDSFISTGDDLVAVKSGWDEYGIAYGRPSSGITIRRVTGSSPFAGIAVGSETSGGVENVLAENISLYNMGVGIHVKTNTGRGGLIRNITFSDVYMENVRKGIKIAGDVGDHPDDNFNPNALPVVKGPRSTQWKCSDVSGAAHERPRHRWPRRNGINGRRRKWRLMGRKVISVNGTVTVVSVSDFSWKDSDVPISFPGNLDSVDSVSSDSSFTTLADLDSGFSFGRTMVAVALGSDSGKSAKRSSRLVTSFPADPTEHEHERR